MMADNELAFFVNTLIQGDNLEILKTMEAESVDLIYLDPPFFSNRNYEVIWGDAGEVRSFQDRWAGGVSHYIEWLKERVAEMHRVLKSTGSIFLHCDWHADAYIRVFILDAIFGMDNFRNAIVWCYAGPGNVKNRLAQKHDTIYFYSKSENLYFDADSIRLPYNKETVARTNRGASSTGIMANVKGDVSERHKNRLNDKGKYPEDYWIDIPRIQGNGSERIGYPTQKPEALLERIIKCASNEGDIVLDPFLGGGTTIAVADRLVRQWIGIDQSPAAVKVTEFRLLKQLDFLSSSYTSDTGAAPFVTRLHKYDYDTLRYKDAFQFEAWIIQQFGGRPNAKQRGDMGLDGKMGDGTPIQVKRQDMAGRVVIDNFLSAVQRYDKNLFEKNVAAKKPVGYIIAFSFGKGAVEEVSRLHTMDKVMINLVKVEDIVPIAVKPSLGVHIEELARDGKGVRQIALTAVGDSPAGIEFYSWDFHHDPADKRFKADVLYDKEGKQVIALQPGTRHIAVKVVDNDGLENIDVVKLTVNGKVERDLSPDG
jgi:DNA modification methylase